MDLSSKQNQHHIFELVQNQLEKLSIKKEQN
jgi:hypothetical protein